MKEMASEKQIAYLEYLRGKAGEPLDGLDMLTKRQASGEIDRHLDAGGGEGKPYPSKARKERAKRRRKRERKRQEHQLDPREAKRQAAIVQRATPQIAGTARFTEQRAREQERAEQQRRISERELALARSRRKRDAPTTTLLHDIMVLARRAGEEVPVTPTLADASREHARLRKLLDA